MTKFKLLKKVTEINLRITAKRHAHFQTLTKMVSDYDQVIPHHKPQTNPWQKALAKFKKEPAKTVDPRTNVMVDQWYMDIYIERRLGLLYAN